MGLYDVQNENFKYNELQHVLNGQKPIIKVKGEGDGLLEQLLQMQGQQESSSEASDSGNEFVFDSDEDMETD